ncbi:hypothetical protein H0I23_11275 [Cellulophaga sp. HaHaR_3_176]|uniref:hypothetical protein n=1 Tax=Cellulophaga sp. HaHaR_3_176 TaxID=1942464 RepID=UPI001C1FB16A|nr:hypothetical protein [Cellulophaga sp. HaHaR_3_176]QWX83039.1 hypothetical protein H0I23_11275 [Cellulophaga sp. HaHaR_3_176]
MNSCEKAAIICNKSQYNEASIIEIMKLKFHMLMCKTCSKFSKKNAVLTSLCQKVNLTSLSENDKAKMKEMLKKQD